MADGNLGFTCPSENDALLLLKGNYKLPDAFWLCVLLKGIYFEDFALSPPGTPLYVLRGTKLVGGGDGNGGLNGLSQDLYNLNRNTEYYVLWKRDVDLRSTQINKLLHGSNETVYSYTMVLVADKNMNPLVPVRR